MQSRNKHRDLMLSATFVGLVCGLVLTHQQAYAAQTPPVSNQERQITAVDAPKNNLTKTAAVNQDYSFENKNIANPAASGYVNPSTYSSPETTANSKQQPANSDATAAAPTPNTGAAVPVANGTAISTNLENNNSTDPATSSPSPDTGNSASTPVAASDNQTNGHSANKVASSVQPETNIIAQGTWGTSKWDYTQEGADYILHLHAGTLGTPGKDHGWGDTWDAGIGSLNAAFKEQLTKIIIDPGVIANQNSRGLFSHLIKLKTIQGLENLDTSQVTNMSEMFGSCESLTNLDLSNFDTSQVTNMSGMFEMCNNLTNLDLSNFDTSRVTDMSSMFSWTGLTNLDLSNFDTSQVTNMSYMFGVTRFTHLDVSNFDTSRVEDMSSMFVWCTNLTNLDVSNFDTSQVTDMAWMFSCCSSLTNLDLSNFDTSQVTNMTQMFDLCLSLTDLDLSHWDTSRVTNMSGMFGQCEHLSSLDVSHFDTSQVTIMYNMFEECYSLTNLDLSHWDTSRVTDMSWMFSDCTSLISLDLSGFNISWDTYVAGILQACNNLNHLVLGPKTKLFSWRGDGSNIPAVPATGTKIPGTDKVVAAPYWVATSGYQQGQHYTSEELEQITGRDQITIYDWAS